MQQYLRSHFSPSEEELRPSLKELTQDERDCIKRVMEKDKIFRDFLSQDEFSDMNIKANRNRFTRTKRRTYSYHDRFDHGYSRNWTAESPFHGFQGGMFEALNEEERYKIYEVLWRERLVNDSVEDKVSRLKMELAMLKKKGVSSNSIWSPDPSRACGRCRSELGRIMNRGAYCKSCRVKVCKNCREYGVKGTEWICNVCHKNLEIKVASGEWVNEYLNKIPPKKKHPKLTLPGSSLLEGATKKKNIRRSWTISNPSGTSGPQLPVRRVNSGDPELKSYAKVDSAAIIHDELSPRLPPPPPVFMSVPQAPLQSNRGGSRPSRSGNVPLRSQSMSQADSDRFFPNNGSSRAMGHRQRHTDAYYRRPSQSYEESSSDNEEGPPWGAPNHNPLRGAKPHHPSKKIVYASSNTSSLDRRKQRRSTPNSSSSRHPHPSHSLPRPPKRLTDSEERRSTIREPTPDYDDSLLSSEAKESVRMKSDSGVDESTSSSTIHPNNRNYYRISEGRRHSLTEKKRFHFEEEEDGKSRVDDDITLSDLESTRVDDYGSLSGDLVDDHDILPSNENKKKVEGNDFKLVFISSCDSSKESDNNTNTRRKKYSPPDIPPKKRTDNNNNNNKKKEDHTLPLLSDSEKIPLSSPSVSTVRTSKATKDSNGSHVPKIYHIPIVLKKYEDPETSSQDAEVRSILRDSRYFQAIKEQEKDFLRVSLLADVTSLVPGSSNSPNRSLSESDLSEVVDYYHLGDNGYHHHPPVVRAWKGEPGRSTGTNSSGPPLPPKTARRQQQQQHKSSNNNNNNSSSLLLETFVDDTSKPRLSRSYSNVGPLDLQRSRPVRRSKSYKGSKSVTNITFDDSEGSHTLPKKKHGQESNDEDIIITRQGANFVRIQIGPKEDRKYSLEELEVEDKPPPTTRRRRGSIALLKTSDTEGDFLDKEINNKSNTLPNQKELLQRLDLKRKELSVLLNNGEHTHGSDADSLSTTSASYIVPHSDDSGDDEHLLGEGNPSFITQENQEEIREKEMNRSTNSNATTSASNSMKRPEKTSSSSSVLDENDTCAPASSVIPNTSTSSGEAGVLAQSGASSSVSKPNLPRHEHQQQIKSNISSKRPSAPKVSDLIARFESSNKSVSSPVVQKNVQETPLTETIVQEEEDLLEEEDEDLPLGAEASSVSQASRELHSPEPPMAPTVRRNSAGGGAYTSYVFISSEPNEDSASSSAAAPLSDRVTVQSSGSCVMTVQDGRSSNISIVSTESSDLSPAVDSEGESNYDSPPPDVPNKSSISNSMAAKELPDLQRSRGGEPLNNSNNKVVAPPPETTEDLDSFDPNVQDGGEGLANYFTNSLEASSAPSRRRMRPSVIRSSRRGIEEEEEDLGEEVEEDVPLTHHPHHGSEEDEEGGSYEEEEEEEVYSDGSEDYEVDYNDEDFNDYPMCRPVYDDSDYSESELLSSGDEDFGGGDREEELRGYNRAIDFTLHTIIEESCEDSESDSSSHHHHHHHHHGQSDPSELEKYFYYGVGGGEDNSCESSFSEEENTTNTTTTTRRQQPKVFHEEGGNSSGATEEEEEEDDLFSHPFSQGSQRRSSSGDSESEKLFNNHSHPIHHQHHHRLEDSRTDVSPVNGPVRKHKSRDSGFVGSCDDLLRNESSSSLPPTHLNTDSAPSLPSDDGTTDGSTKYSSSNSPRFERRLTEIHEQPKEENESDLKASEHEEAMINKMKGFFQGLLPCKKSSSRVDPYEDIREEALDRLMKSVPSLEEDQIMDILMRLAHESTWSSSLGGPYVLHDEEEILLSRMNRMNMDRHISESSLRQLTCQLLDLLKEMDSSKKWRRSWSNNESEALPKLTLLPTEAKIRHTTNSLPRLGTSSIQKSSRISSEVSSSTNSALPSYSTGPARSARYRPPGAKPLPPRKISPSIITSSSSIGAIRKYSSESGILGRFLDDASNDLSSKSGTPSPVIAREIRESSVCSRSSVDTNEDGGEVNSRDERFPSPFTKHGSLSNLGVRSESMASVYSQGEGRYGTVDIRGDVEFGVHYRHGTLEVVVKQCKDLAAVDIKRNRSDPYVKVYLLPDKSKGGKRKTKVKKHTLNPVFDEVLKYQIPLNDIEKRTMWLTVWHSDMFGRNDFLGEVMLPLHGVNLEDTKTRWHNLQDRTAEPLSPDELTAGNASVSSSAYRGELIVALKFVPSAEIPSGKVRQAKGSLQILIKEGKNLLPPKGSSSSNIDPFCKCYLLPGKGYKQKTSVCRRTNKPKWEQTISWDDVTLAELSDRSLELTVWDHDRLGHNEMIGGLRFNNGSGKHQHRFVNWMDSSGKEITLWSQMLERPNFWVEGSVQLRPVERMTSSG